jgi:hypothetical protein
MMDAPTCESDVRKPAERFDLKSDTAPHVGIVLLEIIVQRGPSPLRHGLATSHLARRSPTSIYCTGDHHPGSEGFAVFIVFARESATFANDVKITLEGSYFIDLPAAPSAIAFNGEVVRSGCHLWGRPPIVSHKA